MHQKQPLSSRQHRRHNSPVPGQNTASPPPSPPAMNYSRNIFDDGGGSDITAKLIRHKRLIVIFSSCLLGILFGMIVVGQVDWKAGKFQATNFAHTSPSCIDPPPNPQDRRADKNKLKMVNFNSEWLFLWGGRGGIKCPSEACPWTSKEEAEAHLKDVALMLHSLDADIIHLSEVEDCRVLRALLSEMPSGTGYAPFLVPSKDYATGQNLGILTRVDPSGVIRRSDARVSFPVPSSTCPSPQPPKKGQDLEREKDVEGGDIAVGTAGVTKHYAVPITVANSNGDAFPFIFMGLHFLARPDHKRRCLQREAQATVIRNYARSLTQSGKLADSFLVMMGDFNDYDPSAIGTDGRHPISNVLPILHDAATPSLVNAATLIPPLQRYSCWFDVNQNCRLDGSRERVLIDHVLLDPRLVVKEAFVHHGWNPTCDERVSDHWPVVITVDLTARPPTNQK